MKLVTLILALLSLPAPEVRREALDAAIRSRLSRSLLADAAVGLEIMDDRERRYLLANEDDFESDLDILRDRYGRLKDAPFVAEAERFPDRMTVNEYLDFNRAYRRHVDAAILTRTMRDGLWEIDQLYYIWDTVRDSRCEYYYITTRRDALARLRDMIGPEDFATATLPPYVPLWRFREFP